MDASARLEPDETLSLRALACEAAAAAADLQRSSYRALIDVERKDGYGDVVTEVDRASEDAIRRIIRARRPEDGFVGEESGHASDGDDVWFVDPLDGTANYIRGAAEFAVSIALERRGWPVLGVVEAPALATRWTGDATGAHRNDDNLRLAEPRDLRDTVWATGFSGNPSRRQAQLDVLREVMTHIRDMRRTGSPALDLAHVADRTIDGFFELGLSRWDYSAGVAIVEAAGGTARVIDLGRGRAAVVAGHTELVGEMVTILEACGAFRDAAAAVEPNAAVRP